MDYQDTGGSEGAARALTEFTSAASGSSTPLLSASIATGGEGEASQPLSANINEEPPTPLPPVPATILFIVMFLPLIIILGSLWAFARSKQDPLGFSVLAVHLLFSLGPCGLGVAFLARVLYFPLQITPPPPRTPFHGTLELTNPNNQDGNNRPCDTKVF